MLIITAHHITSKTHSNENVKDKLNLVNRPNQIYITNTDSLTKLTLRFSVDSAKLSYQLG